MDWEKTYRVNLAPDFQVELPLLDIGGGFCIYSFDMTGESMWNRVSARELAKKLKGIDFDGIVTVQTKSCGLAQALTTELDLPDYLELRKSRKSFMIDPKGISVQSITTAAKQELWIGKEKYSRFTGKKMLFLDDVVSTGGTIDAVLQLAKEIGIEITAAACAILEGDPRDSYNGMPLIWLDRIPLPGQIG